MDNLYFGIDFFYVLKLLVYYIDMINIIFGFLLIDFKEGGFGGLWRSWDVCKESFGYRVLVCGSKGGF